MPLSKSGRTKGLRDISRCHLNLLSVRVVKQKKEVVMWWREAECVVRRVCLGSWKNPDRTVMAPVQTEQLHVQSWEQVLIVSQSAVWHCPWQLVIQRHFLPQTPDKSLFFFFIYSCGSESAAVGFFFPKQQWHMNKHGCGAIGIEAPTWLVKWNGPWKSWKVCFSFF